MRVGLLGVSHWHASIHAAAIKSAGSDLAWVWDADQKLAADFGSAQDCTVCSHLDGLTAGSCDAVVVMGKPTEMADRVRVVAARGLPAIVEKPVTTSAPDLAALAAELAERGAFVAVALPQRISPIWQAFDRRDGHDDTISHAQFRIINGPPERYRIDKVPWMLDPGVSGGGALRNVGIHGVDSFLRLVGPQDVVVEHASFGRNLRPEAIEDYALVILRAADGTVGAVEAGYCHASMAPGGDFEWRIATREAYFVDRGDRLLRTTLHDGRTTELAGLQTSRRYEAFMKDALERLASGRPPAATLDDCRRAMELIDRAYDAGRGVLSRVASDLQDR
jgi:predicted dehydrogenase